MNSDKFLPGISRKTKNLLILLTVGLTSPFMLRWFEHSQVYCPSAVIEETGEVLGRPWEDVSFAAADGIRLNGWFFPADSDSPRKAEAVLVCHGNGGNISHRLDIYQALLENGLNVFAFDYRGYGRSGGKPSESGTYLDAEASLQWLEAKGFSGTNVFILGESLGGGIAAELACRHNVGGLILQSTFTSIPAIGAEIFPWLPVKWLCSIHYDTLSKLPRLRIPIIVMHSRIDSVVQYHHAEKNFAAANAPKLFCELAGDHNETLLAGPEEYRKAIREFLRLVDKARQ